MAGDLPSARAWASRASSAADDRPVASGESPEPTASTGMPEHSVGVRFAALADAQVRLRAGAPAAAAERAFEAAAGFARARHRLEQGRALLVAGRRHATVPDGAAPVPSYATPPASPPAVQAVPAHAPAAEPGLSELSHRARQVAELVARGRTNRAVAAELYLTKKVERHLTSIFRKLGTPSRAALAWRVAAAARIAG